MTLSSSLVSDALRAEGPANFAITGLRQVTCANMTVYGRVRTLRYLPARPGTTKPGQARLSLLESIQPGDVIVCDAMGKQALVFGDMAAMRAVKQGLVGFITDGFVRDAAAIESLGLPVFAQGITSGPGHQAFVDWEYDVPVQCGGALVMSGDGIVADRDGALVIPENMRAAVEARTEAIQEEEAFSQLLLQRGHRLGDAYPLPEALRNHYEAFRKTGALPPPDVVGPL